MVVSRWLVMPIAAMSAPPSPSEVTASVIMAYSVAQISIGLCSTIPGLGKCCVNSFWRTAWASPFLLKTIALEELVP